MVYQGRTWCQVDNNSLYGIDDANVFPAEAQRKIPTVEVENDLPEVDETTVEVLSDQVGGIEGLLNHQIIDVRM
jgi:hypothetical protein